MRKIYYLCIAIYVLQAVTVLVRDMKYYKIETSQLQVLMTFCEEDLLPVYWYICFTGCDGTGTRCEVL